jgi:ornithine cyclodeaminase/alanine dehydrogenase-like protein (mu-crystallin family)
MRILSANEVVRLLDIGDCIREVENAFRARGEGKRASSVRATLDQVVTRNSAGRRIDDEIIIFDSTGVAIEDVAAAALVYERAESTNTGFVI